MINPINMKGKTELSYNTRALYLPGSLSCLSQCRQQERHQQRDDRDDDQEFNEREREALTLLNSQALPALPALSIVEGSIAEGQLDDRAAEGPRSATMKGIGPARILGFIRMLNRHGLE